MDKQRSTKYTHKTKDRVKDPCHILSFKKAVGPTSLIKKFPEIFVYMATFLLHCVLLNYELKISKYF